MESKAFSRLVENDDFLRRQQNCDEKNQEIYFPRIQNMLLSNHPQGKPTEPENVKRLKIINRGKLHSPSLFDVENMYHDIALSPHFVRLLPLTKIPHRNLSGSLQCKLALSFGFRPRQGEFMRPYLAILSMGFK